MLCYKESKVDAKFRKYESKSAGIWFGAGKKTLDLMAGIAVRLLKEAETARQRPQSVDFDDARTSAGFRMGMQFIHRDQNVIRPNRTDFLK